MAGPHRRNPNPAPPGTRRDFLYGLGATLGTVALNALLQQEAGAAGAGGPSSPLAPKPPHVRPRAKRCIFLYMEGGPSHIDTFDPKPKLDDLHLKEFQRNDEFASAMASGKRYYIQSPFNFIRAGESGIPMNEHFSHLAQVADELCVYRGMQGESINHPTANYHMNTGNRFGGDPAVGAWASYGLGTLNQNLPSFIVLPEKAYPQGGAANWSNGFLPAYYQGTALRPTGSPILDLKPPEGVSRDVQRRNLDLLKKLNTQHQQRHPQHGDLAARTQAYELAYRMQAQVPQIVNLDQEPPFIRRMYGLGQRRTHEFGRRCLLARRLLEEGVRFVQLYAGTWDSHDYIHKAHGNLIKTVDQPIAALIKDLRQRGMLEDTLIIWAGEFGRSPDNGMRGGKKVGRDHNAEAMNIWMAGGGVNAGHIIGGTDEIGARAVDTVHPIRNFHVTLLHLLGLDDSKLTYFHGGRFKQLSQTGGKIIPELLA